MNHRTVATRATATTAAALLDKIIRDAPFMIEEERNQPPINETAQRFDPTISAQRPRVSRLARP